MKGGLHTHMLAFAVWSLDYVWLSHTLWTNDQRLIDESWSYTTCKKTVGTGKRFNSTSAMPPADSALASKIMLFAVTPPQDKRHIKTRIRNVPFADVSKLGDVSQPRSRPKFASQSLPHESIDIRMRCRLLVHPVEALLNLNQATRGKLVQCFETKNRCEHHAPMSGHVLGSSPEKYRQGMGPV